MSSSLEQEGTPWAIICYNRIVQKPISSDAYQPPAPNFYSGRGLVVATRANLPHWDKANTACFVTFRLVDALPQEKLRALEERRTDWLAAHPQPWDATIAREYMEMFDGKVQEWLDAGYGSCVLREENNRKIVEDALWHFAGERYSLYAYVVMPNHVHVMFMPSQGFAISDIVMNWKRFTAKMINESSGRSGSLWQKESFDRLVRNERHFRTIVDYIRRNDLDRAWVAYR